MTRTTNKKIVITLTIISVGIISLVFIVQKMTNYRNVRMCPNLNKQGSTEENLSLMRQNLVSITNHFPKQELNGVVFFKKRISIEQFVDLVKKYEIKIGTQKTLSDRTSIQLYHEGKNIKAGVLGTELKPEHFNVESFYHWMPNSDLKDLYPEIIPENVTINSFAANTTANNFLKMWQENEDIIRGIGVECTMLWYVPNPEDGIKFGGPSIFN